jgi:polar amino acid transport system substrate-binding protein
MSVASRIARPFCAVTRRCLAFACVALAVSSPVPWCTAAGTESMSFVMQSFPPFAFEEQGQPQGPFPETLFAVCEAMKVECRLTVYPWRRALRLAEDGSVDGILVIQKMDDRAQNFYLTDAVMYSSYGLYVRQDSALHDASAAHLAGYTVGAYGPSATSRAAAEMLKSVPSARLELEIDNLTVLKKLSAQRYGEKGAAVVNVDVANYLIKQDGLTRLKMAGEIRQIAYMIGLSKSRISGPQAQRFRMTLRRLRDNGTLQKIAEKYGLHAARPSLAASEK